MPHSVDPDRLGPRFRAIEWGMGNPSFALNIDGEHYPDARNADLESILAGVAAGTLEFAILSEEHSGFFVQAAGAYGALTVEYQHQTKTGRRQHFRLCRPDLGDAGLVRRAPLVPGYQGYLEKEVLSVEDGFSIFTTFLDTLRVPERFETIDISAELGFE